MLLIELAILAMCRRGGRGLYNLSYKISKRGLLEEFLLPFGFFFVWDMEFLISVHPWLLNPIYLTGSVRIVDIIGRLSFV
jgi:hypothetical protein